jgi:hypothetical protein
MSQIEVLQPIAAFKTRGRGAPGKGFLEMAVIFSWIMFCALLTWIATWMQR